MYENDKDIEKVILFAVDLDNGDDVEASLDELEELIKTAGAEVVGRLVQNREKLESGTYLGTGKLEELRDMAISLEATGVCCAFTGPDEKY